MAKIIIPERLAARLAHDKTWDSCVTQFKKNIEPLLAKDPDFFPDYTIHGIDHINRVLDIADHLIDFDTLSEEPKVSDLLTPRDVAFLVCGIMLHDMGMFLRPDGVRKLVQMDHTDDAFDGKPWKDEWSDYVDRMKRLSQEKMRYHFGRVIPVTEDCVNHTDTDDNKRIIGEFLRQHHARLAHEFATGKLMGSKDLDLFEKTDLKEKDRKLIGLLARSHGMAIRDTEAYVEKHIGKGAKPYKTPVLYLMTVLRTADALDADERRAPEKLEQQQKIDVPISVEEWTWNQCIDPDACDWRMEQKNRYIEADPKSSPQYVQLDKWLKGIQADLDLCWSILAEKYPYDRYRLSIHRVVSNIHEPGIRETMNETFLTREVKITANPEIVKLMIAPLYGNDPSYGIRELLQNAVDACLERKHWEEKHGNPNYEGLVDIRIENDTFTITDNGMGMNEDILLNYYLSAGSSYRNSDAWKAANAHGNWSEVARTGKFGVGFLASFLLGSKIHVHTQHRSNSKGYSFEFSQDSKPINVVRKYRSTGPGTTIVIKLNDSVSRELQFNTSWYSWYAFDSPKVQYTFNDQVLSNTGLTLSRNPKDNPYWFPLPSEHFELCLWNPNPSRITPYFYCNGIRISNFPSKKLVDFGLDVPSPHISVLDNNAHLEVDLARNTVAKFPDELSLYKSVFHWYIAKLLLTTWDTPEHFKQNLATGTRLKFNVPFLFSKNGFTLNHISFISGLNINRYVILYGVEGEPDELLRKAHTALPYNLPYSVVIRDASEKIQYASHSETHTPYYDAASFIEILLRGKYSIFQVNNMSYAIAPCSTALWIHQDVMPYIYDRSIKDFNRIVYDEEKASWYYTRSPLRNDTWYRIEVAYCSMSSPSSEEHYLDAYVPQVYRPTIDLSNVPFNTFPVVIQLEFDSKRYLDTAESNPNSLFAHTLREVLVPDQTYPEQDYWIPFDMAERKKKFPKAFEELKPYMDHIRKYPIE